MPHQLYVYISFCFISLTFGHSWHCLTFCLSPSSSHQWRVRKEAMMGLASIYRKYSLQGEGGREASKQISWIKDKLLHIYYQNSIDDRFVFPIAVLKM